MFYMACINCNSLIYFHVHWKIYITRLINMALDSIFSILFNILTIKYWALNTFLFVNKTTVECKIIYYIGSIILKLKYKYL